MKDQIPGGLADGKPDSDFDPKQLAAGVAVELEHTTSRAVAKEIAKDHLTEDPDYYKKLRKMEGKMKKSYADLVAHGEMIKAEQLGLFSHKPKAKAGPFIGPRGGKWADPKHTIPWKEGGETKGKQAEKPAEKEKKPATAHEKIHGVTQEHKEKHQAKASEHAKRKSHHHQQMNYSAGPLGESTVHNAHKEAFDAHHAAVAAHDRAAFDPEHSARADGLSEEAEEKTKKAGKVDAHVERRDNHHHLTSYYSQVATSGPKADEARAAEKAHLEASQERNRAIRGEEGGDWTAVSATEKAHRAGAAYHESYAKMADDETAWLEKQTSGIKGEGEHYDRARHANMQAAALSRKSALLHRAAAESPADRVKVKRAIDHGKAVREAGGKAAHAQSALDHHLSEQMHKKEGNLHAALAHAEARKSHVSAYDDPTMQRSRAASVSSKTARDVEEGKSTLKVKVPKSAMSVFETDVVELAADPAGHGLSHEEAASYQLLARAIRKGHLHVPSSPDDANRIADLLTDLSNSYDDQAEGKGATGDKKFSRAASKALGAMASKIRMGGTMSKSYESLVARGEELIKAGPYIGPKGGKWADAAHTIPWKGGEGSRGGKVIGHTAGGKPIYEGTKEHHKAQMEFHGKKADEYLEKKRANPQKTKEQVKQWDADHEKQKEHASAFMIHKHAHEAHEQAEWEKDPGQFKPFMKKSIDHRIAGLPFNLAEKPVCEDMSKSYTHGQTSFGAGELLDEMVDIRQAGANGGMPDEDLKAARERIYAEPEIVVTEAAIGNNNPYGTSH